MKYAIVVSGLPASGKTTIGKKLAKALGIQFLDKDDLLESLFDRKGIGDLDWRRKLSNESNILFEDSARQSGSVLLVSHWRITGGQGQSGTPTEWIAELFDRVVEVYCDCSEDVAVRRFVNRNRHDGHCDADREKTELLAWMKDYADGLPLQIGPVVRLPSSDHINVVETAKRIRELIQA